MRPSNLFIELKRRRVFRVAGLYIVGCWVLLQVVALGFQSLAIPDSALRWVWIALIAAFPLAIVIGWRYDITGEGIVRTPPADVDDDVDLSLRSGDYVVLASIAVIAIAVLYNLAQQVSDTSSNVDRPAAMPNSVAVLPLANMSGEPDQGYFVDGMHEAIIADLARISGLKVISRVSTLQYRDSPKPASVIGEELGVAHLIEGSVLRDAEEVRINVQLIDAHSDEHLWSDSYQRDLVNVLDLQSSLARAIANQVRVKLTQYEEEQFSSRAAVDPIAYELYLKGRFHWYRFSEADLKLSLEYFQRSIDKDPTYALAYVGFADALATPAHMGMMPTTQVFPAATQFVERALELEPELAEAHDLLARIRFVYDWDWDAAERGFRRAISLKPGYPDVHVVYSQFLAIMNRPDASLDEARTAVSLDPMNPWYRIEYAQRQAWYGDFDGAYAELQSVIERHPDLAEPYQYLWEIAATAGRYVTASESAQHYFRLQGEEAVSELIAASTPRSEADYRQLMRQVARELENNAGRPYIAGTNLATVRMHADDVEGAMDHLDEALRQHDTQLVYTAANPVFKPLWATDRYLQLRARLNLE